MATAFVTYLLIEVVCFIFIKTKFTSAHFPTFQFHYHYTSYDFPIAEINSAWGTWHYPGIYTEQKQCFKSVYHINSFGARDKERVKNTDTNRVIFLGDSFIEGYGLSAEDRLTNILEKSLHKEVLNFGCGYFTPTQSAILYDSLAKQFSHNTVVLGILPFNDLAADDTSFHEQDGFIHYQPYFQGTNPDYHLMYREDHLSKSTFNRQGYYDLQNNTKARIKRGLKEFTFWYNIYRFIETNKSVKQRDKPTYSGYYDCTTEQLQKLGFILSRLKRSASARRVLIIALPVQNDFARSASNSISPFSQFMSSETARLGIEYVDLLPLFRKRADPADLYLSCDGHWNATANKITAEIILPLLSDK